jgi:hypothetical protein
MADMQIVTGVVNGSGYVETFFDTHDLILLSEIKKALDPFGTRAPAHVVPPNFAVGSTAAAASNDLIMVR